MAAINCVRRLSYQVAEGPLNMALDEALLQTAAEKGVASLRFYGWSEPTLSLGYFQPTAVRQPPSPLSALPWVRRPTGGNALVHHHELTYALALPPGFAADWMRRMHEKVILPALARLGAGDGLRIVDKDHGAGETLCFQQLTPGDLTCAGHKVAGSAQRKYRRCLLQHGAILLARSEYAPALPGLVELTTVAAGLADLEKALVREFQRETGWRIETGQLSDEEMELALETVANQFGTALWNEKR